MFEKKMLFNPQHHGKMDRKLKHIIQEAKLEPVLVRICQLLESILVHSNQKLEEKDARITELEEKVSKCEKRYSSHMTVVQNELDDLKERMLSIEMYDSKDTVNVDKLPERRNGDLLRTILSFFNSNLQFELSHVYRSMSLSWKTPTVQCNCYICVFCPKAFHLTMEKEFEGHRQQDGVSCISHRKFATNMSGTTT